MMKDKKKWLLDSKGVCIPKLIVLSYHGSAMSTRNESSVEGVVGVYPSVLNDSFVPPVPIVEVETQDNVFEGIVPISPIKQDKKLLKMRIDYASSKAGSLLIAKSKGMSGADALFVSSKYKYALSECRVEKWFVFSLAEMILIDSIATSNFERFSSSVKDFLVYGSAVYPTISWSFIGYFRAKDKSDLQVFNVTTTTWVKYIRVEWVSWYRNEAICTMSTFCVYGSNMMNAVLSNDLVKDVKSNGLKEIITEVEEEVEQKVIEEEKKEEVIPKETISLPPSISPEYKPLYEMYAQCEKEQEELALSLTLLHNKTKTKIRVVREKLNNTDTEVEAMKDAMGRLASVVEEEKKKMAAVENKLFVMQRSVYHAQTWSVIAVGCMVTVVVMGRVKEGRRREKEEEMKVLQKQVMLLQKQVDALKGSGVKQSVAKKESPTLTKYSPTLTKKESKKKKV
ncbi:SAD1, spindle pole body-associated protein [Blastocystis sp. ATCC 50177/Nand II]|uniref:SAD1, spindle pole body-associated protein n=1 Tax=Blastocystis sp. subtype 1 (strain ATCC 50177 / NandII) TaxID=478820 RepID=A0A196SNL3_BLAHN|nr:SAD1, spindle pole body-associated protein [Blastocystis sp. ATCC 50177/Nand II]